MEDRTTPYDPSEQRVAAFFVEAGSGGGADPVGALIASHRYAMGEWNDAKGEIAALRAAINGLLRLVGELTGDRTSGMEPVKVAHAALMYEPPNP